MIFRIYTDYPDRVPQYAVPLYLRAGLITCNYNETYGITGVQPDYGNATLVSVDSLPMPYL